MAEPGVGCGKLSGVFPFLPLESSILFARRKPSLFAASRVPLGHAASIVTQANRRRENMAAACCVLEPRPTKENIEDEDDDEYEDDFWFVGQAGAHAVAGVPNEVDPRSPCRRRFRGARTNLG
jgi:hypothetical protein